MPKELVNGYELFDGEEVQIYEIKILGSAYMNAKDAAHLSHGDKVTLMLTVQLGDPKFSHVRKSGELKRTNNAKIEHLLAFDPESAQYVYDNLGQAVEGVNYGLIDSNETGQETGKQQEEFNL